MRRSISVDADEFYSRNEVETSRKKGEKKGSKKKGCHATRQDSVILELLQLSPGFLISNNSKEIYYYVHCEEWYLYWQHGIYIYN